MVSFPRADPRQRAHSASLPLQGLARPRGAEWPRRRAELPARHQRTLCKFWRCLQFAEVSASISRIQAANQCASEQLVDLTDAEKCQLGLSYALGCQATSACCILSNVLKYASSACWMSVGAHLFTAYSCGPLFCAYRNRALRIE